jgi:hypothetical protein
MVHGILVFLPLKNSTVCSYFQWLQAKELGVNSSGINLCEVTLKFALFFEFFEISILPKLGLYYKLKDSKELFHAHLTLSRFQITHYKGFSKKILLAHLWFFYTGSSNFIGF